MTWSPTFRPLRISIVLTELRPKCTGVRTASPLADKFEDADRRAVLGKGGPADEENVVEPFELDRAVDAQVGTGAFRERAIECDIDRDGALFDCGIDADDVTGNDAVARIDRGRLIDLNILRLGLGDLDLRFQFRRIGDAGEVGSGDDALADFDRQVAGARRSCRR